MKSQGAAKNEANNVAQAKTVSEKPVEKIDFSKVEIEPLFKDEVDFETFSKSDFRAVKVKECVAVPKSKKLLQFTLDDGTGVERTILSGLTAQAPTALAQDSTKPECYLVQSMKKRAKKNFIF